jgi:thioredoxin reductase/Pyruvate/2-oxoacid:ferredoxin oxidoreductase delta subunit
LNWFLAYMPVVVVGLAVLLLLRRRGELLEYAKNHQELADAKERGSHKARLQHPDLDLSKCIGCGTCIKACPEDGVLSLIHGQAVVIHGARCVGHGLCAAACPTNAIALTLGDLSGRRDLPALDESLEVVGVPGLFLAGELGGFALVRTAVSQGIAVADAVAHHLQSVSPPGQEGAAGGGSDMEGGGDEAVDFLIVGSGPGGLACSLRAKELGLDFLTIEQEEKIGGTVASYPRRKMVMTQPVVLPLHGRLPHLTYQKEDLIAIWEEAATKNDLPIRTSVRLVDFARGDDGLLHANTSEGVIRARCICLALGRRGTPRKLDVPGEDLPKVAYSLLDAESYQGRRILVVGGGDSAIEAAIGLAKQPGNEVTLSYRKKDFFRLKARNETNIRKALHEDKVRAIFESQVLAIEPEQVRIRSGSNGDGEETVLPNDEVFVFAGGIPPFGLLENGGVSFDPKDRPPPAELVEKSGGLLATLVVVLICATAMLGWAIWHRAYYGLNVSLRPGSEPHRLLRPAGAVGLTFGLLACGLFVWNLTYLVRRSTRLGRWLPGTLKFWLSSHIFTGLFAFLCVLIHAGFMVRPTVGGHAFLALTVVVITGFIGRYIYAFVPRAANGTAVDLEDLRTKLASLSAEWDRNGRGFGEKVRDQIDHLITKGRWHPNLLVRLWVMGTGQIRLRRSLMHLRFQAKSEGIPNDEFRRILTLAKKAYRLTLMVTHYEEVRAVLSSWRYLHRWLALLMVLLAAIHITVAVRYSKIGWDTFAFWHGGNP